MQSHSRQAVVAEPDYKAKYIELLEQQAAPKATQDVPTGTPAATDSAADPFALSDEQKQLLTTYNEEWPEVSKAEALRTQIIVHTALAQFANQLRQELAPIVGKFQATAASDHMGTIRGAHPDFDTLKPDIKAWVSEQPAALKQAYEQVITKGSALEVVSLVGTYKKVHGIGLTPQEQSTAPKVTTPAAPTAVQKAAEKLAVVSGKRSVVPKGVDSSDFDGAWREAIGS